MLVYRTVSPFKGIRRHPLEVLCLGQQFLAYADHPETRAPYAWPEEGLADIDIASLPGITAEQAAAFLDEASALLPEALRQKSLGIGATGEVMVPSHARFLILPSDEDYPDENFSAGLRNTPSALVGGLHLVAAGGGSQVGNLAGKTSGSNGAADAVVVPMTPEAKACFTELSAEITEELRAAVGTPFTAILARIGENALKIALIVAVGREPVQPLIGREDAEWAIGFVRHFAKRTMDAVERHVADSETEAHLKRVREIIRAAGKNGLTKSEITRASQWLKARDRNDILETLVESGDIKPVMRGSATKQAMAFLLVR